MSGSPTISLILFVHIPDTRLHDGLQIPHAGGVLRRLDYAEWSKVDSEISSKRRRAFEAAKPCFYVQTAIVPFEEEVPDADPTAEPEMILARIEAATSRWKSAADPTLKAGIQAAAEVRLALALMSGAPTRSIEESISYVSSGDTTSRTVGRLERRAILDNRPELMIFAGDVAKIAPLLHLITAAKPATELGEFAQAVATLGSTALPDLEPIDGLMHTAIALEAILLADVTSGVTAAFVERGAALLANDPSEIAPIRSILETIYAMRSDALHGRVGVHSPEAAPDAFLLWRWTRKALARALIRILHVCQGAADCPTRLVELRAELDSARTSLTIPVILAGAPSGPQL